MEEEQERQLAPLLPLLLLPLRRDTLGLRSGERGSWKRWHKRRELQEQP